MSEKDYEKVEKEFSVEDSRVAAHVMFFARTNSLLWKKHKHIALVNMHLRFDGLLGFPGGLIDPGESVEVGLNREVKEEMGLDFGITAEDWISTYYSAKNKILNHFYCKEVEESKFLEIERSSIHAEEYGVEILGHIRVPLYNYMNRRGKPVGLAQFLQQRFAGNGRDQLLACLQAKHILTSEEISAALSQDVSG